MENVAAIIVTRGDHDLTPIYHSIADAGIALIKTWDNSKQDDLAVYGRYAMIAETEEPLIYVQDDDVVLPPESIREIIETWSGKEPTVEELAAAGVIGNIGPTGPRGPVVVANMPQPFRHDFYSDHCLVGFGAVFRRDLPKWAFADFDAMNPDVNFDFYMRTADVVFTGLTSRVLVDVPYENLPWAEDGSRMFKQNGHVAERTRMLDLVRKVRDAA